LAVPKFVFLLLRFSCWTCFLRCRFSQDPWPESTFPPRLSPIGPIFIFDWSSSTGSGAFFSGEGFFGGLCRPSLFFVISVSLDRRSRGLGPRGVFLVGRFYWRLVFLPCLSACVPWSPRPCSSGRGPLSRFPLESGWGASFRRDSFFIPIGFFFLKC